MIEASNHPKNRVILLIWMVLSQLLMVATLFIWILVIGGLFIMATNSTSPRHWIQAIIAGMYPTVPITFVVGSWVAYSRRKNLMAALLSGLSFLMPVPFYYLLASI